MTIKEAIVRGLEAHGRGSWEDNKEFILEALVNDPNNDGSEDYAEWFAKSLEWYGTREDVENYLAGYIEDEALQQAYGWDTATEAVEDILGAYAFGQYPWEVWGDEDEDIWFISILN